MTREKREIIKKLHELDAHMEAENAFGGQLPDSFIRWFVCEEDRLLGRLVVLQHYDSIGAMLNDDREMSALTGRRCLA